MDIDSSRFRRTLPAVAALTYPALIWCGPALTPVFLGASLLVPVLGLVTAHRLSGARYLRSRSIAIAVVGTPPLYSWLGGMLDFQNAVPINGLAVWIPLWTSLGWVAFTEKAKTPGAPRTRSRGLAVAHGISASVITIFAVAHLTNHLTGLWGAQLHMAVMTTLRLGYRHPIVESILLVSVGFQFVSGLRLLQHKVAIAESWFDTLQAASGAYLAMFFVSHLSAVFRARYFRQIDTNWLWLTADSLLRDPWSARLAPYYFLAVIALGAHVGLGLRYVVLSHGRSPAMASRVFTALTTAAVGAAALILFALTR